MKPTYNTDELVINWHLTEACNYGCRYCYAAWKKPDPKRELIHSEDKTLKLLDELYTFFQPGNPLNPLIGQLRWKSVRLNLAGGEPLLYASKLPAVLEKASQLGFETSMITNASTLTSELLNILASQLKWLGISIDSGDVMTSQKIGRMSRCGKLLDMNVLSGALAAARSLYPQFSLKLNTVVNRLNHQEDMNKFVTGFSPEKWKVLRMLPVINNHLAITDQQYEDFVVRHQQHAGIMYAEDNHEMRNSYIMVDPHGRFFQNAETLKEESYQYSRLITEVGASAAFSDISFSAEKFCNRYATHSEGA